MRCARALPGLNAGALGLLVAASFQLVFQARQTSPMPAASICIGACLLARAAAATLVTSARVAAPAAVPPVTCIDVRLLWPDICCCSSSA